jgi:hypothetical protein
MPFTFTLELEGGSPSEPPTFATAVPDSKAGNAIPVGNDRTLRVIEVRDGPEADDDLVLVVENA